jgi:hypothetical protein
MTRDEIKKLMALASSATPGPWGTNYSGNIWGDCDNPAHDGDAPLLAKTWGETEQSRIDSAFIASANPETVKRLCQEAIANALAFEQLRADLKEMTLRYEQAADALDRVWIPHVKRLEEHAKAFPVPLPVPLILPSEEDAAKFYDERSTWKTWSPHFKTEKSWFLSGFRFAKSCLSLEGKKP